MSENYAPGGPLEVFFGLSEAQALIRPPTPAYLSAALTFEKAMADIADGADVIDALDAAVDDRVLPQGAGRGRDHEVGPGQHLGGYPLVDRIIFDQQNFRHCVARSVNVPKMVSRPSNTYYRCL